MISRNNGIFNVKKFIVGALSANCYLVYAEKGREGVLIDPGAYDPGITRYIKDNNVDVKYVINTHGHPDHTAADSDFGFPVLIHKLDEIYLRHFGGRTIKIKKFLEDKDTLSIGTFELGIIHTPGHTPGGISIKCSDLVFSGDTLFFEGIGRTDLPGGSYEVLLKSIKEKLFILPDSTRVFPGHGQETTIGHEKKNNPFLQS